TEVLPHLIEASYQGDIEKAVRAALSDVEGVYGIVVVSADEPSKIVVARRGPPLVIGLGSGANFVASDIPALLPYTRQMLLLKCNEVAMIGPGLVEIRDMNGMLISREPETVGWSAAMAEKEGYSHFMLKEIYEQPRAIRDTVYGRIQRGGSIDLS